MYCEKTESVNINIRDLTLLHYGAFLHYFNNCQYHNAIAVKNYCDRLCNDWEQLPEDFKDLISLQLKSAWRKEQDYGKNNPVTSPFGNHQEYWYEVVEKVLQV